MERPAPPLEKSEGVFDLDLIAWGLMEIDQRPGLN